MSINERIKLIKNIKTKSQISFSIEIDIPEGTINGVIGTRKSTPSYPLIAAILRTYRDINPYWLILGEGKMYNEEEKTEDNNTLIQLGNKLESLKKHVEQLEQKIK